MPYVDQGELKPPTSLSPVLPIVAVLVAMGLGVGTFWLTYTKLNGNQWLAPLVAGPLIGVALRFVGKRPLPKAGLVAVLAALVTCLAGYVLRHILWIKWVDSTFQPTVGHAFEWLFSNDLMSFLLIGMSAYLAFAIGAIPSYGPPQQSQQPPQTPPDA